MRLFFLIAIFVWLGSLASVSYSQVPQIERDALVALYNSTGGANWRDNTGWLGAAGTECDWYGVTCSSASVSSLNLIYNSLSGSIPPELGNLTNLSFLQLSNNSLTGPIPSELSNLQKLDSLFLAQNSLTGRTPQWILDRSWTNLALNAAFNYMPVLEWSSPYNGVTPDSSLGLDLNNIGFFDQEPKMFRDDSVPAIYIYTCINAFTDGLASSLNGISQFDIDLKVVSLSDSTVQVDQSRQFNTIGAFNESAESPDCSGKFETTTGVYTDIIQVGTSVLDTTWSLIDSTNLILKLSSYQELTAN